jgi:hypothetical protein
VRKKRIRTITSIIDLPDELLIECFHFLDQFDLIQSVCYTCFKFHHVVKSSSCWMNRTFEIIQEEGVSCVSESFLRDIISIDYSLQLQRLVLKNTKSTEFILKRLFLCDPIFLSLTSLEISGTLGTYIMFDQFIDILLDFPNLTLLNISCEIFNCELSEEKQQMWNNTNEISIQQLVFNPVFKHYELFIATQFFDELVNKIKNIRSITIPDTLTCFWNSTRCAAIRVHFETLFQLYCEQLEELVVYLFIPKSSIHSIENAVFKLLKYMKIVGSENKLQQFMQRMPRIQSSSTHVVLESTQQASYNRIRYLDNLGTTETLELRQYRIHGCDWLQYIDSNLKQLIFQNCEWINTTDTNPKNQIENVTIVDGSTTLTLTHLQKYFPQAKISFIDTN